MGKKFCKRQSLQYATTAWLIVLACIQSGCPEGKIGAANQLAPQSVAVKCPRGIKADVCGVCAGDGKSCLGCDNKPNSGKVKDVCGVCGGDGKSCLGCDGKPKSGKVFDACHVCGGDGRSCKPKIRGLVYQNVIPDATTRRVSMAIDVPSDIQALQVIVRYFDWSFPTSGGIIDLIAPDGTKVVDNFSYRTANFKGNTYYQDPWINDDHVAAVRIPFLGAEYATPLQHGRWQLNLLVQGVHGEVLPKPLDVSVHLFTAFDFQDAIQDLNIYIPPGVTIDGEPIDAATALANPKVMARINQYYVRLQQETGIGRGAVRAFAADARFVTVEDAEIRQSESVTVQAPAGRPAAQVLLTNQIAREAGVIGQAPLFGNWFMPGRQSSMVAVVARVSPEVFAEVTMHEIGHLIGLPHTTEIGGGVYDAYDDTPECNPWPSDATGVFSCPDASYTMFPMTWKVGQRLSPTQRMVYISSGLFQVKPGSPEVRVENVVPVPLSLEADVLGASASELRYPGPNPIVE